MTLAQRLYRLRTAKNLSRTKLGFAAGVARNTIEMAEAGKASPTVRTVASLAAALGMGLSRFFEGVEV